MHDDSIYYAIHIMSLPKVINSDNIYMNLHVGWVLVIKYDNTTLALPYCSTSTGTSSLALHCSYCACDSWVQTLLRPK